MAAMEISKARELTCCAVNADTRCAVHHDEGRDERMRLFAQLEMTPTEKKPKKTTKRGLRRRRKRGAKKNCKKTDETSDDDARTVDHGELQKILMANFEPSTTEAPMRRQRAQQTREDSGIYRNLAVELKPSKRQKKPAHDDVKPPGSYAQETAKTREMVKPSEFLVSQLGAAAFGPVHRRGEKRREQQLGAPAPAALEEASPAIIEAPVSEAPAAPPRMRSRATTLRQSRSSPHIRKSVLPSLLPQSDEVIASTINRRVEEWQERVEKHAELSSKRSPRGYVYQARAPLFNRSCFGELYEPQPRDTQQRMAPLPRAARAPEARPLANGRLRKSYGPMGCYPASNIKEFAKAYESLYANGTVPFGTLQTHPVILANTYFSQRASSIASKRGSDIRLNLRDALREFFPYLLKNEVSELHARFALECDDNATRRDRKRRIEVRQLFDLFDVDQTSLVNLWDFRTAILSTNNPSTEDDWPVVRGAVQKQIDLVVAKKNRGGKTTGPILLSFDDFYAMIHDGITDDGPSINNNNLRQGD